MLYIIKLALDAPLLYGKSGLIEKIEGLLHDEFENVGHANFEREKFGAYRDAAVAFLDERIETYNPLGIQYTFDRTTSNLAEQLELQLNFYDSRAEFQALTETADAKDEPYMTDQRLLQLANELISEMGAFPDRSIISAYLAEPALPKLPDYVVAKAIEEITST